ncbi:phage tail protein [Sphingomonas sp.]|uniref:phage tail protein n=1 Tax=Sphingomonas sp. TaxID=28214 RepID=UPI003BAD076E
MDAFIGEIRMFPFGYAPVGWYACDGRQLQISQDPALYSLLGIRFGGDGKSNFNLPNLNGRIPVDAGASSPSGQQFTFAAKVGQETVTLTHAQAPSHSHSFSTKLSGASTAGMTGVAGATNNVGTSLMSRALTNAAKITAAYDAPPLAAGDKTTLGMKVSAAYGTLGQAPQPHPNLQPYLVLGYYICNDGEYPVNPD